MIKISKRVKKIEISNNRNRRELSSLHTVGSYQIKTSELGGGRHSVFDTESPQPTISRQESRDREITFVMVATKK